MCIDNVNTSNQNRLKKDDCVPCARVIHRLVSLKYLIINFHAKKVQILKPKFIWWKYICLYNLGLNYYVVFLFLLRKKQWIINEILKNSGVVSFNGMFFWNYHFEQKKISIDVIWCTWCVSVSSGNMEFEIFFNRWKQFESLCHR